VLHVNAEHTGCAEPTHLNNKSTSEDHSLIVTGVTGRALHYGCTKEYLKDRLGIVVGWNSVYDL
jgi:hypothetical protein